MLERERVWYAPAQLEENPAMIFSLDYWRQHNKIIGHAQGRSTVWFVQAEAMPAVLRHYYRGGVIGRFVKDRYFFISWERTRSHQELNVLETLFRAGVHVPKPIAARAKRHGLFYQADLMTQKIPNAQSLCSLLLQTTLAKGVYQKIGEEIAKMHRAQVNHSDLNIHNILLDEQQKVWLIDFDKCYQQDRDDWKKSNLNRLQSSFEKEASQRGIYWTAEDFNALMTGYLGVLS